jgi:hypothetical protein
MYGNMLVMIVRHGSHARGKHGDHYFLKINFHVANEKLYFSKGFETML